MKKSLEESIQETIATAKKEGIKPKRFFERKSSLHRLIKTRQQAEHFMILLKYEMEKNNEESSQQPRAEK